MKTILFSAVLSASLTLTCAGAFAGEISCFVDNEPSCRTKVVLEQSKISIDNEACPTNVSPTLVGEFPVVDALTTDGVLGTYAGRSQDQGPAIVVNLNKEIGTNVYSGTLVYFGSQTELRTLTCTATE